MNMTRRTRRKSDPRAPKSRRQSAPERKRSIDAQRTWLSRKAAKGDGFSILVADLLARNRAELQDLQAMCDRVLVARGEVQAAVQRLNSLAGQFQTEWANYAAGSVLVSLPVMALFLLLNRFLVSGLTLGGVKS